jgi:hypothetical protein
MTQPITHSDIAASFIDVEVKKLLDSLLVFTKDRTAFGTGTASQVLTSTGPDSSPTWQDSQGGGGGGSQPLAQVVFGTGTGVTSDSGFTYDPNTQTLTLNGTTLVTAGGIIDIVSAQGGVARLRGPDSGAAEGGVIHAGSAIPGQGGDVSIAPGVGTTPGNLVITLSGEMRINSDAGIAGRVLTSNGPGAAPTWTTVGAGSAPATEILFGTGGGTTSNSGFTFDPVTGELGLVDAAIASMVIGGGVQISTRDIVGDGDSGSISFATGIPGNTGNAGSIEFIAGVPNEGNGGGIFFTASAGQGTGDHDGGIVEFEAGQASGAGVAGHINFNIPAAGTLQINHDPGLAGQVLTSNGPGVAPTWQ